MNERKNVYQLPLGDTTLEWYSKAVVEMKKRATTDPTSWNYQAAMHGFNLTLPYWKNIGPVPGPSEQKGFWNQCQHGSWFFLPWHRMYLAYFEQIVAQTIVGLGGPQGWTLPFWDYSDATNPIALDIPTSFTNPAATTNGLWMKGRVSNILIKRNVALTPLKNPVYTGNGITSRLGFGGPETTFSHSGGTHGDLEGHIHDSVHVMIGGAMGDPRTAGLDPIFWLHHANIDRLWQVWLNQGNRANPTQSSWTDFTFAFHDKNGNSAEMKVGDVVDTRNVLTGYTYQGVRPALPTLQSVNLMKNVDFSLPLEVTAATNKHVALSSAKTLVQLALSPSKAKMVSFAATKTMVNIPKTTILHFENITGKGVPPIHDVYLNPPKDGQNKEAYYAGSLSFFGVEEASKPSFHNSGSGQHYALDITDLMNLLRSLPGWDDQKLDISIEATRNMGENTTVTIGRISLYSE